MEQNESKATFVVVSDNKALTTPTGNENLARKRFKEILSAYAPSDLKIIKQEEIYNLNDLKTDEIVNTFEEIFKEKLLPMISKNILSENLPKYLEKIQAATEQGNIERVISLINKYKPSKALRSKKETKTKVLSMQSLVRETTKQLLDLGDDYESNAYPFIDVISFLEISHKLAKGKLQQAVDQMHYLDTGARDQIPEHLWNWVLSFDE